MHNCVVILSTNWKHMDPDLPIYHFVLYMDIHRKKKQERKNGAAFRCLLVSIVDPSQYVRGEIGMKNQVDHNHQTVINHFI